MKKTLRAFNIARSSTQTLEATDKAIKRVSVRVNKQAGVKFCWRKNQNPDQYIVYRNDANSGDRRSVDEICQQELKNAVCITLKEQGPLDKDSLLKAAIRMMGYARSCAADGIKVDVLLMDPPRAGSSEEFLEAAAQIAPARIVYVSCNPETMERDVSFLEKKGYRAKEVYPVDMFPWTGSIETIALLRKSN